MNFESQEKHQKHLTELIEMHNRLISESVIKNVFDFVKFQQSMQSQLAKSNPIDWYNYLNDRAERAILTLDVLRESGDEFVKSESNGHKPVLDFDSELVIDGNTLPNPVNYVLLRIKDIDYPTPRDHQIEHSPVVIIDPRAGHGPGIGGFKKDSEVGIALKAGHPVYFISFKDKPEPNQTTTHVVEAHAEFLKYVNKAHKNAPPPIVIGNCQGGWAGALVTATHPTLNSALVLNGTPLSYWAGKDGQNPMRYLGGMLGGALPAILSADLSDGTFDGANLVMNFEALNPANTWFRKYKDLFDKVDSEAERFKEFDNWWSGFYLMNSAEIKWILDNLFVGNKLSRGQVTLDNGDEVNLENITSPIFIFASWGDNITPPAQALSWIIETYEKISNLKRAGRRIIYTLHEEIGHLGIFVSKQIAQREHQTISSVIDYANALPPGLYEMAIEHESSPPVFRFYERSFDDLKKLGAKYQEDAEFELIKNFSESLEKWYEKSIQPVLKIQQNPLKGKLMRSLHPMRMRRSSISQSNPFMLGIKLAAPEVKKKRSSRYVERSIEVKNPVENVENHATNWIESSMQLMSANRDALFEIAFHEIYGSLIQLYKSKVDSNAHHHHQVLNSEKYALHDGLDNLRKAVVRMVLLLIKARGGMRGAHLITFKELLEKNEFFTKLTQKQRELLLAHESAIVSENPDLATDDLCHLLKNSKDKNQAIKLLESVVGKAEQLSESPRNMMFKIFQKLGLDYKLLEA